MIEIFCNPGEVREATIQARVYGKSRTTPYSNNLHVIMPLDLVLKMWGSKTFGKVDKGRIAR
eukprot:2518966-Karenia_brevis.AAC.1